MHTQRSEQLFAEAQSLIPGGVNSPVRAFRGVGGTPRFVARGEGAYFFDEDGNRYVDYICSWGPLIRGHAHPEVVAAISAQAARGTSYGAPTALESELARLVIEAVPSVELVRFVNSGTEATMSALRLARAYTRRNKIIKFSGCYHGHADMLLVAAGSGVATLGLPDSPGVTPSTAADTLTAAFNNLDEVEALLKANPEQVAALIVEPVVGNAGLIVPREGFLAGLRRLCDEHGAVLIFDEVMTGFRVAYGGAQAAYGVLPDLTCLGKVIGGGLPVGAYGGRKEMMQMVAPAGPMYQAGTLSGNPLAMAAGLATLKPLGNPAVYAELTRRGEQLLDGIRAACEEHEVPVQTGQAGSMFGFFFCETAVTDYASAKKSDTARYGRVYHALLERGVYLAPSQFEAGFLSTAHTEDVIAETVAAFEQALAVAK
jgi:glutamate-1-semialdehyde 2,1-aminomutase